MVGTGSGGIELLVVIIINGIRPILHAWAAADFSDLVQLYELPLWTSATAICGTIGLMVGGPVGAALTDHLGFRL